MKKKILFLSPQLPYPPVSGGTIKSWKLVEYLAARYSLFTAYFLKGEDEQHEKEFLGKVQLDGHYSEAIDIPRTAANLVKSNLMGIPLNLYRNRSAGFQRRIREMASGYEVLFVDHYEMFQFVPADFKGRIILHQHNCEYLMWERFAEVEPAFIKRLALKNQSWRIRSYERRICNRSDRVLAAPNDIEELKKIGATETIYLETYHLGDEALLASPELSFGASEPALMFVGTLTWEANVDGLVWFLEEGWPSIKARHPELKFYIIGKTPDARIVRLAGEAGDDVVLTGFVEDLEDYFSRSRVFVSPLRFGSGIKVKVMNALYRGIPTVTTSVGAEGMAVADGEHIMIRDDIPGFVAAIDLLLEDAAKWETLKTRSRALARSKYTWDAVLDIVRESIEE